MLYFIKCYGDEQVKEDDMGGTYSIHGRNEKYVHNFSQKKTWKEETTWENNIKMDLKRERVWGCGLDSSGSGQGPVAGYCEHDNSLWTP